MKTHRLLHFALIVLSSLITLALVSNNACADETEDEKTKNWKTRFELSFVNTSGNTENSTFASKMEVEGKLGANRMFFDANIIVQSSDGEETANRTIVNGQIERILGDDFFILVELQAERDTFSGYDSRLSVGPGFGYDVIKQASVDIKTYASAVYVSDTFSMGEEESDRYLTLKLALDTVFRVQDNLEIKNGFDFINSTEDPENYVVNNQTALTVKINNSLGIGLSYQINFNNSPPQESIEKLNTTFFSSLVFTF